MTATVTDEDREKAREIIRQGGKSEWRELLVERIAQALAEVRARTRSTVWAEANEIWEERLITRIADLEAQVTALQVMNESLKEQLTARVCASPTDTTDRKPTL